MTANSFSSGPSLFLGRQDWENLKDKLQDPFFEKIHQNNLKAIELLDQEKRGGDLTKVPCMLGEKDSPLTNIGDRVLKNRVLRGTVAWYLTGERRRLDFIFKSLEAACESPHWFPSAHGVRGAWLPTGDLMYLLVFALDTLGHEMDAAQRERYVAAVRDKGLAGYLRGLELKDWWENCNFNWGPALHGNAGLAALLLRESDPELSARVLLEVRRRLQTVIDYFYPGGGYTEGVMYQAGTIGHLTDFVRPFFHLTGDDLGLSTNQAFIDLITSWQFFEGGDRRPLNFSNIDAGTLEWGCPQVFWWANRLQRPDWVYFQEQKLRSWRDTHGCHFDIECFWFREVFPASTPPQTEGLHHFKGIDWLTWKGPKTWLGLRAGFNGDNHNNLDLGHFILGYEEERFLVDPGYGASQTSQHNAVTIRKAGQTDCSTAPLTEVSAQPGGFIANCDLSACFPYALTSYQRHLHLIDDLHLLVVDRIHGRGVTRNSARWYLQTRFPWRREDNGNLIIEGPRHCLTVWFLTDVGYFQATDWTWDGPLSTLSWTEAYDRIDSIHAMLLTFGTPQISHRLQNGQGEVSINGKIWRY